MPKQFPLFVDISGKSIMVFGAGKIASRRIAAMLDFQPAITVAAPAAELFVKDLAEKGRLTWEKRTYQAGELSRDVFFVLAATDDGDINREIAGECREKGIPVNVSSDKDLCDFHFPGLAVKDELVIGINAGGSNHRLAKTWTDKIKREVEENGYDTASETASDNG